MSGTVAGFHAQRGLFEPASCGKRGRVFPSPEYRLSGAETLVIECPPSFATIYCASTVAGRKRVNCGSTQISCGFTASRAAGALVAAFDPKLPLASCYRLIVSAKRKSMRFHSEVN